MTTRAEREAIRGFLEVSCADKTEPARELITKYMQTREGRLKVVQSALRPAGERLEARKALLAGRAPDEDPPKGPTNFMLLLLAIPVTERDTEVYRELQAIVEEHRGLYRVPLVKIPFAEHFTRVEEVLDE